MVDAVAPTYDERQILANLIVFMDGSKDRSKLSTQGNMIAA